MHESRRLFKNDAEHLGVFNMEFLIYYIVLTFGTITPKVLNLSPYGYRLCIQKCLHMSGCELIEFTRISLTCKSLTLLPYKSQSDRFYLNLSIWKKPCTHSEENGLCHCIETRLSGEQCVPHSRARVYSAYTLQGGDGRTTQGVAKRRPVGRLQSNTKLPKKRKAQPKITGFIAAVRRDIIQLKLFYLNTRLPTVQSKRYRGRILDMKTWSNRIYWCQEKPSKCVKLEFIPQRKKFRLLNETTVVGETIAVDELAGFVFIGDNDTSLIITHLNLVTKTTTPMRKHPYNLQACHKTRWLFVGYGSDTVGVHTYGGQFIRKITLMHPVEAIDVSVGGVLYAADRGGHLSVLNHHHSNRRDIQKSNLPHNINPNVFADEHGVLMINDMQILSMDTQTYKVDYLNVTPPFKRSEEVQYAALYAKQPQLSVSRGRGSLEGCHLGSEGIMLASSLYQSTSRECTQLTKVDLKTGKTTLKQFLQARLVDLDIDNSAMYWCQAAPHGIHQHKIGSVLDKEPLLKEGCHAIAGDTSQNLIFYATSVHLTRYSIDQTSRKLMNIFRKNTNIKELQVFLDRRDRIVYVCLGKGKKIYWSEYDLAKRREFGSYQRSKIFTISNDGKFYYTNARTDVLQFGVIEVTSFRRQRFLKKKLKLKIGIKRIILVGDKIVVEMKRSVRVFCKNFREAKIPTPWLRLKQRSLHIVGVN